MNNSIQRFAAFGTYNIEKAIKNFFENPQNIAGLVKTIQEEITKLGLDIISETLESCDQFICESEARKKSWNIVRKDRKQLLTSLGEVSFHKTLFINKVNGKRAYLLDKNLGLESHERISEDAQAKILEEAVQTSYRRAGEHASIMDLVSKQAVMDKLHALNFPQEQYNGKKKVVKYLYIDADEDHIALQKSGSEHSAMVKMVYVYEGIEPESYGSKRMRLVNPHYFCGMYGGKQNKKLWVRIYRYIEQHYDLNKIKKIYLNADGGTWIKRALNYIDGLRYVLDEFHLSQNLFRMTSSLSKNADAARRKNYNLISAGKKSKLENYVKELARGTDSESAEKRILAELDYILNNFEAARIRLKKEEGLLPCSAEGHVSHVLSSRMSSKPIAWSIVGVDAMARLRAYYLNGGSMLGLVRF